MELIPAGWRWPRIVTHICDHPSTTVTFGFMLFLVASWGAFFAPGVIRLSADMWLWCVVLSTILIGGVRVSKDIMAAMQMRLTGGRSTDAAKS